MAKRLDGLSEFMEEENIIVANYFILRMSQSNVVF
jgi:hypothetical protein